MRILVVDDHRNTRDALALGLSLLGLDVRTAAAGEEALEQLEAAAVDWLVSDVRMPGMGGIELASRVRSTTVEIGLILMTAYDVAPDERRRIRDLGAVLLIKPVTADTLAARCVGSAGAADILRVPRI